MCLVPFLTVDIDYILGSNYQQYYLWSDSLHGVYDHEQRMLMLSVKKTFSMSWIERS